MQFLDFFARQGDGFYACVAQQGYGVVRYILDPHDDPSGVKGTDASEVARIRAHGIPLALVYETTGGAYEGPGYFTAEQGRHDMTIAIERARAVGYPEGRGLALFLAVDTDVTAEQAVEYFNGAFAVLRDAGFPYLLGVYGGHRVTGAVWPAVAYRWQTAAWSYGVVDAADNLYQRAQETVCGVTCDLNDVTGDLAWAWHDKEEDMGISKDDLIAVLTEYGLLDKYKFPALQKLVESLYHHVHEDPANASITSQPVIVPFDGALFEGSSAPLADGTVQKIAWMSKNADGTWLFYDAAGNRLA